jgi:hypothetical protein
VSWPEVIVIVACLAAAVAALWVVMPFVRVRTQDDVKAAALADLNKRLVTLESELLEGGRRSLPAIPRRMG